MKRKGETYDGVKKENEFLKGIKQGFSIFTKGTISNINFIQLFLYNVTKILKVLKTLL